LYGAATLQNDQTSKLQLKTLKTFATSHFLISRMASKLALKKTKTKNTLTRLFKVITRFLVLVCGLMRTRLHF
jgi:hypothetical protein